MFTKPVVKEIHQALQAIFSDSDVLLGGSYWAGEATNSSDLDFYILRPLLHFFAYKRSLPAVQKLKQQFFGTTINCMVMPHFFYERGWYYVTGETVDGKTWQSPLNTKIIFRTAIKLVYWNYVLFFTAQEPVEKQFTLTKMAQHLAVAKAIEANVVPNYNGFTTTFLLERLPSSDNHWKSIRELLEAKQSGRALSSVELECVSKQLFALVEQLFITSQQYWHFSLANYVIYNSKFLRHKNSLFLFKNPDKMLVDRLRNGLKNQEGLSRLREEMRTIVFPVIMI